MKNITWSRWIWRLPRGDWGETLCTPPKPGDSDADDEDSDDSDNDYNDYNDDYGSHEHHYPPFVENKISPKKLLLEGINCIIQQILMGKTVLGPQQFGWELFRKLLFSISSIICVLSRQNPLFVTKYDLPIIFGLECLCHIYSS